MKSRLMAILIKQSFILLMFTLICGGSYAKSANNSQLKLILGTWLPQTHMIKGKIIDTSQSKDYFVFLKNGTYKILQEKQQGYGYWQLKNKKLFMGEPATSIKKADRKNFRAVIIKKLTQNVLEFYNEEYKETVILRKKRN